MAQIRAVSSRASITATSFVNQYHWGSFKGNPADWMRRYFDAFVYTANWRCRQLSLRIPRAMFEPSALACFATDAALTVDDAHTHWVINWSFDDSEDQDYDTIDGAQGAMGRLLPLRDELLRGDNRPLYLGWLAAVCCGEVNDDSVEPAVPPGLLTLSAAQQALVEFLEIDPDLLLAATAGSAQADAWCDDDSVEVWMSELTRSESELIFKLLLQGESALAERRVKLAFSDWQKESGSVDPTCTSGRTAGQLLQLADQAQSRRKAQQAQEQACLAAARRAEREAVLRKMALDVGRYWHAIEVEVARGAPAYGAVTKAIAELAEAYAIVLRSAEFDSALALFMQRHGRRRALVQRLVDAGYWYKQ